MTHTHSVKSGLLMYICEENFDQKTHRILVLSSTNEARIYWQGFLRSTRKNLFQIILQLSFGSNHFSIKYFCMSLSSIKSNTSPQPYLMIFMNDHFWCRHFVPFDRFSISAGNASIDVEIALRIVYWFRKKAFSCAFYWY